MDTTYNPKSIEKKWQALWEAEGAFVCRLDKQKKKFYALVEFPYPSGEGLHVGHPRPYTALDIIARKRRMEGENVLFPMGWDAFGLPAENYAITNKIHPKDVTEKNIARFKKQCRALGFSFDWSREVSTTDPAYYKWTQWIFLKLFERGLAYKAQMPINWCPSCKVGLANEEAAGGVCERCGEQVIRREKSQWMLKITAYADRLINDLADLDYIDRVKAQQINWIGRSEGCEIDFALSGAKDALRVFTTRADTLFGATYMVIAPEHPILDKHKDRIENWDAVCAYRAAALQKTDFERSQVIKEKTGVRVEGLFCVNPATNGEIPVFVSDYVLISYGTGAIMAVPAHDERDYEFARAFGLPIVEVVKGGDISKEAFTDTQNGVLVNSGLLNGLRVNEAIEKMTAYLSEKGCAAPKVNYKLRDWVFSRQRYWGEPIPIVICERCGFAPLSEADLPLLLPEVPRYETSDDGQSPLAKIDAFVNTVCPKCGGPAKRETDTMPQWAGSSWYFLRYLDPACGTAIASKEAIEYFMPVDWYNGGMEHTTLHLLYSRFWHKFLYDIGVVTTSEPYVKRTSHGMILGENNEKMSKSRGNIVNPDDIVSEYGADTLRAYEMFIGAFELAAAWSTDGVKGCRRFLERVWRLTEFLTPEKNYSSELYALMHKTVKKVSDDYEKMKFNTAIAALMTLVNEFYRLRRVTAGEFETLLTLLNPVAPHITEELYERAGHKNKIFQTKWPSYDAAAFETDTVDIGVTVNGKAKGSLKVLASDASDEAKVALLAAAIPAVKNACAGKNIVKTVYIKGKIINIVAR